jgi:nucleoid-associated protein YgaU
MKTYKLLLLCVALAAFVVTGCSKPPVQELDQAKTAMQAAKDSGAEKCQLPEYLEAKAKLEAAQMKMDEAEKGGKKSKLYEEAKADLIAAIADFEKAKAKADDYKATDEKAKSELAALKANLDRNKANGEKYNLPSYRDAVDKYNKAKELVEKCKGEEALALMDQANGDLKKVEEEYAAAKAEEMRAEQERMKANSMMVEPASEKYTVVRGDNLWNISKAKYMNPFMWPIIYWANDKLIQDPDLIYPGQVFDIMTNVAGDDKAKAEKFSRNRGPWSLFDGK